MTSSLKAMGDDGFHSREERRRAQRLGVLSRVPFDGDGMTRQQVREWTPPDFRDVLLSLARACAA